VSNARAGDSGTACVWPRGGGAEGADFVKTGAKGGESAFVEEEPAFQLMQFATGQAKPEEDRRNPAAVAEVQHCGGL
jgi:hypothetical protein